MTTESRTMRKLLRNAACVLLILTAVPLSIVTGARAQAGAQTGPPSVPFDPARTFSLDDLKADLQVLWDVLEEGHGGFDRYTPAAALRKSFDAVEKELTAPLTEIEFYAKLLPLIAEIEDGHTRLSLSSASSVYLDSRPLCLPFEPRFLGDKAYVLRDLSSDRVIGDGAELLAVDGRSARDIVAALLPLVPADAGIRTAKLRRLEDPAAFGRLYGLRFGRRGSFRVRFRPFRATEVKEALVPGIAAADIPRLIRQRYPATADRPANYELSFKGSKAVLTIRQFGDDPDRTRPRFPDFLTEGFRSLEEKKTPGLVIDLRGNGGGFDEYGKMLFAHFMDRPFLYYWTMEAKKDRYDLFRYTDETEESAAELARPLRRNERGRFDVLGHPNRGLQMPRTPHFSGWVAILIDGGSRSATGEAVTAFHYYKKASFFGEEGGAGYYGNTAYLVTATLPNSRIQVGIPLVLSMMAVDGYPKDRGLVPEYPVTPTIGDVLAGRDPVMERALAYLEKR